MNKKSINKKVVIGITLALIIIASILFSYKFILYTINLKKSENSSDTKFKIIYCKKALDYEKTVYAKDVLVNDIETLSKQDVFSAESYALISESYIEAKRFNQLMIDINLLKAKVLVKTDANKAIECLLKAKNYGYDFTKDTIYKECLFKLAGTFLKVTDESRISQLYQKQFDTGDLDNDGIYEIAILGVDKGEYGSMVDISNEELSELKVYKFMDANSNEAGYKLVTMQTIDGMVDNYGQLLISKASKDINGIFYSVYAGAHSGSTGLDIYKENKLTPINIGGNSMYPSEIKDIDNDGILEVGALEPMPGSEALCDADTPFIEKWYKWDGQSSGILVKTIYPDH